MESMNKIKQGIPRLKSDLFSVEGFGGSGKTCFVTKIKFVKQ